MKLFGWFRGQQGENGALADWRRAWMAAVDGPPRSDDELRARLQALAATEPDVELEEEMLDALAQLRTAQNAVASGGLPVVETQHRIVGAEPCHFSAPASVSTDGSQASGRVLLTKGRAIFVGGVKPAAVAWHLVHGVTRTERDVLLVGSDSTLMAHYRFNTYGDAIVCAFLSQQLRPARRARL